MMVASPLVMLLALLISPVLSQIPRGSAYEDGVDRTAAWDAMLECRRGMHRTASDVTTSGNGSCRRPRRAHTVDDNDHFGKLIAPLLPHEFLLPSSGGSWGLSPRHISRRDEEHFKSMMNKTNTNKNLEIPKGIPS